jgi:hypothetical protein
MLRRVALVITDVSEELSTSFIRVTKIGELVTTLAFLLEPHGVTSQKRQFFVVFIVSVVEVNEIRPIIRTYLINT